MTDLGRMESTRAAAAAAGADAARLEHLYREGQQASLKVWQAAQAQSAESAAQARAAELAFRLQWGPLAALSPAARATLLQRRDPRPAAAAARGCARACVRQCDRSARAGGGRRHAGRRARARRTAAHRRAVAEQPAGCSQLERAPPGLGPGARVSRAAAGRRRHGAAGAGRGAALRAGGHVRLSAA